MKLDRDFLKSGVQKVEVPASETIGDVVVVPESLRSKEPEPKLTQPKFVYDPAILTPTQLAEQGSIFDSAVKYCSEFDVKVANHLAEAMEWRADKQKVLSPREADIVARGKTDLTNEFFWDSLFTMCGYLQEGELNFRFNPWELRTRYNNGLHWKTNLRENANATQKLKGDTAIQEIIGTLEAYKLPLYPVEKGMGVSRELCKPEFLSWEQYEVYRAGFKMGTEEHQKGLLT